MSLNIVNEIDTWVNIKHVLISVSDKSGLERLVPDMIQVVPELKILSTGGTFARIASILGDKAEQHLMPVSTYTGQPETQGGLVKTLDFKIYLGLLTETYNDAHQADLERTNATAIDMVIVNLYPFAAAIAQTDVTPEKARGNIDIGGPCMIRAAAKNYIRVASVVDPADYTEITQTLQQHNGSLPLELRYRLAQKAFAHTAQYDRTISGYLEQQTAADVAACYGSRS